MVQRKPVLYVIVTAFVIGLISGIALPFTDLTLPVVGAGLTGLIAGGVAGYLARAGPGSGAVHGFLATSIGGLLVGLFLLLTGTILAGVIGLGVGLVFLTLVAAHGIPGAVGGAIGGILGRDTPTAGQPTP